MATTQEPRTPRRRRTARAEDVADGGVLDAVAEALTETPTPRLEDTEVLGDPAKVLPATAAHDVVGAAEPAPSDQGRSKWDPRRITGEAPILPLGVLFGLNAVDELDRTAFSVLLPEIKRAFGLDLQGVLTLTTAILVVNLILELPIGYIADRRNRVRIATAGAFFWGLFSVGTGLSIAMTSIGLLYLMRIGSSLAKNLNTTHRSLLSDYYPVEQRARVFYAHSFANNLGQILGPLLAGAIGALAGASIPFFVLSLPTFALVFIAAGKLREPKRGVYERLAAGADEATAETEEKAAGFSETFRVLFNNKSARRIYMALPFITIAAAGLGSILSLFYDEVYNVGPFQRGLIMVAGEAMQIAGVVFGFRFVQKIMVKDPGRVMKLLAFVAVFYSLTVVGIAGSLNVYMAVFFQALGAGANAVLLPGVLAVISLSVPPRMRSLGFATGSIFILLGAIFIPVIGGVGDAYGLRVGLLVFLPVYLLGSFLLSSAGGPLNDDIKKIQQSALTQAEARRRRDEGDAQMLIIRGLDAGYDQTQILFGVDLEVSDGEIIALLGTNGAGKSTLLKAISGILTPSAGAIIFDGEDITSADAIQSAHLGIAQVPGGRGIFPTLTVGENIRAAGWMYRKDKGYLDESVQRILEYFPILKTRWDTPAGSLSGGEQQMLSLAQAFIAKPKLLMIDELSLGLAPTIVEQLLEIVRAIHAQGTTIILVEQSVNVALRIAERAVFMEKGEIRFFGPTADLLARPDVLRSVFLQGAQTGMEIGGSEGDAGGQPSTKELMTPAQRKADQARRDALLEAPVVLEARNIVKRYGGVRAVNDVTFQLHEGQILGLIGPNGAGKTTIFDMLSGFTPINGGEVHLLGRDVTSWAPHERASIGLGRSFQDARLWPSLTVREALATALAQRVDITSPLPVAFGLPAAADSEVAVQKKVDELIALLGLGAFRDKFVSELSTGSRRMVEIATLIANEPKVLILDEPSSGIAQKETEALGPVLKEVQRFTGCSILIIEHDMPLLASLADHVVGLELGAVIAFGTPDEVLNHPQVIASYLGTASYEEIGVTGATGATGSATEVRGNGTSSTRTRRRRSPGAQ
jgi:ABC-type branched-subunit amino acid transport system ATPase component/sugar phosphate permease